MQRSSSGRLWDLSGSPKGRTEVILGVSEAKNAQETDFDVKTCLALQKPGKNQEKCDFRTDFLRIFFFGFLMFFRASRVVGG